MLTVAVPKRNKLPNIIVLTPKDGLCCSNEQCGFVENQKKDKNK